MAHGQPFEPILVVDQLDGTNGFAMSGVFLGVELVVGPAGDLNNDGLPDLLMGNSTALLNGATRGEAYVVFGRQTPFPSLLPLEALDERDGFTVRGSDDTNDFMGDSVSGAGDVNGDGLEDFLIGASNSSRPDMDGFCCYGQVYLVYGREEYPRSFSVLDLQPGQGVVFDGESTQDLAGSRVAGLGDVNGDGFADIGIGAEGGFFSPGKVYVIFGSPDLAFSIDLEEVDASNGFVFETGESFALGYRVAPAGDLNGDGLDDVAIGATHADTNGIENAGAVYVVFGAPSYPTGTLFPWSLDGEVGFTVAGSEEFEFAGRARTAGDFNGDGLQDLIVGATEGGNVGTGSAYVLFGRSDGFASEVLLRDLDGIDGFAIRSENAAGGFGVDATGVGDINGDGVSDLLVGSSSGNDSLGLFLTPVDYQEELIIATGAAHVLFGALQDFPPEVSVETLDGTDGFTVNGITNFSFLGETVTGPGDINGDGLADVLIGAPGEDIFGENLGAVYSVFGRSILETDFVGEACPGPGTILIQGATPDAEIALIISQDLGVSSAPAGICDGLELSLEAPRFIGKITADASGNASLSGNVPGSACGGLVQAVDLSACRKSAVVPLPAAGSWGYGNNRPRTHPKL